MLQVLKKHNLHGKPLASLAEKKQMIAGLPDRQAFVVDMLAAYKQSRDRYPPLAGDAQLQDVEISDDSAKGTILQQRDGGAQKTNVEFAKEGGGWKMTFLYIPSEPAKKK